MNGFQLKNLLGIERGQLQGNRNPLLYKNIGADNKLVISLLKNIH